MKGHSSISLKHTNTYVYCSVTILIRCRTYATRINVLCYENQIKNIKMAKNVTYSQLRRLGLENRTNGSSEPVSERFRSSSQDLLNENNIKDRLDAELNWLEGSRPNSRSIEDLLNPNSEKRSDRTGISSTIEEKKKKLTQAGLFRDRLPQPGLPQLLSGSNAGSNETSEPRLYRKTTYANGIPTRGWNSSRNASELFQNLKKQT